MHGLAQTISWKTCQASRRLAHTSRVGVTDNRGQMKLSQNKTFRLEWISGINHPLDFRGKKPSREPVQLWCYYRNHRTGLEFFIDLPGITLIWSSCKRSVNFQHFSRLTDLGTVLEVVLFAAVMTQLTDHVNSEARARSMRMRVLLLTALWLPRTRIHVTTSKIGAPLNGSCNDFAKHPHFSTPCRLSWCVRTDEVLISAIISFA